MPQAIEVHEWLKGLHNLTQGDADHVEVQAQIVYEMKRRARTLEIVLSNGWTVGIDRNNVNEKGHTL